MPGLTSVAPAGYGFWVRMVGLDAEVLWMPSNDEVPEAVSWDTCRRQVADPSAICLSAWVQNLFAVIQ